MTNRHELDAEEQWNPPPKSQQSVPQAPASLSDIAGAPTDRLAEKTPPTPRRAAASPSHRSPAIADLSTTLLGPLPRRESALISAADPAADTRPAQPKATSDAIQPPAEQRGINQPVADVVPQHETELTIPPAPSGTGSARFFWLQGVALRIAERIEGPLQAEPFWSASPGRTPEKRQAVRAQAQTFLDRTPGLKQLQHHDEEEFLLRMVEDEVLGYGPLEPLLVDERERGHGRRTIAGLCRARGQNR